MRFLRGLPVELHGFGKRSLGLPNHGVVGARWSYSQLYKPELFALKSLPHSFSSRAPHYILYTLITLPNQVYL